MHAAEQVVANAKTVLTGLATTGARVYDSQVYPLKDIDLPALKIDQGDESIEPGTVGDQLDRTMELRVIAVVKQQTSYRTTVNTIRSEVETALAANQTLAGICHYVRPVSTVLELSGEGELPVCEATMTFSVRYFTNYNAPHVPLF